MVMDMTGIITNVSSFITEVGSNSVLLSVVVLLIAASIGSLAFATIKRFARR